MLRMLAKQTTTTTTTTTTTETTTASSASANQELIDQLTTLQNNLPFATTNHHHSLKNQSHQYEQANPSLKLDMMSQLLCSQALIESHSFKPLSYDTFNQFKKSITQLDNQRQSINSKINLELKILETTNILQSNPTDNLVHFPTKFKQLHQQKESIQSQLSKQQTSLLQHLAAVLAQGFKRIEQQLLNSNNPHSSIHHQPSPIEPQPHSPSTAPTTLSSRSVTLSSRFDGPHLFVNKQTRPTLQTPYRAKEPPDRLPFSSPSSSPQLNNYTNSNLLKQEIESLKALLNARDAIVAEQAADLSLLELEVETLKQSLADQSNNHQQLASARSSSERNTQKELDRLNAENAQLIEQLQSSKNQTESSNYELKRLKNEMEIIHSDRQLERMSELNENLATRARDAEEHTRKIEIAKAELETQLVSLKADLEAARRSNETAAELESQLAVLKIDLQAARLSKDSALDERDSLQNNFKACQSQIEALSSELEILRTSAADQTSKHDRQCAALEATNRAEWESLASLLMSLRSKLDHKMSPKLAQFLSQSHDLTQPNKFAEGLVNCLEEYMTITNQALASQQDLGPALRAELDEARRTHDQQTVELTSRLKELEEQQTQLQQRNKELETAQEQRAAGENGKVDASELDAVKRELVAVKQQLVTAREPSTPVENRLREIWRMLPPNLEARGAASLDTDLSGFKAVYEQPKKVVTSGVTGGLGGLFGLGKRTPTPTTTTNTSTTSSTLSATDEQEFSVENTLEKLKLLVENDKKLVDRLFKYEAEKDSHKNNSIRAQKLVAESQDALRVYQSQVKELEERLEYADTQSAAMLEKVNDLMESEEKANMVARRASSTIQQYQREIAELKTQLSQAGAGVGVGLGAGEQQLKQQIQDLHVEINTLKAREMAQRDQFLREMAQINGRS